MQETFIQIYVARRFTDFVSAEALKARPSEKVQRSQRWAVLKHMAIICVFSKGLSLGF